jgi:hypothetical protein
VRPELMEFEKYNQTSNVSLFLSLVAHPGNVDVPASFRFTKKSDTMVNEAAVGTLDYDESNLADLYAQSLFVANIEARNISEVLNLDMIAGGSGTINLNQGNVEQVTQMSFYEAGQPSMTITNDSIVFGAAGGTFNTNEGDITNVKNMTLTTDGVVDINDGNIINVELMTLTADSGVIDLNNGTLKTSGGNIDMDGGSIINAVDLSVGEIRLHNTNVIENSNVDNSLLIEGVDFDTGNISLVQSLTFVADSTGVMNVNHGTVENVNSLNMSTYGTLAMNDGNITNTMYMDFGPTFAIERGAGQGGVTLISNPAGGDVDLEGILFNNDAMTSVTNVTFTASQPNNVNTLDLNNGLLDKVSTMNLNTDKSGVIQANEGNILNVTYMDFGANLEIDRAAGQGGAPLISNPNGDIDLEGILFNTDTISSVTTVTFDPAGTLTMPQGTIQQTQLIHMDPAGVLDMNNGTLNNLLTLNMSPNGTLNMNQSNVHDISYMDMTDVLTIGSATDGMVLDGPNATINHTNMGVLKIEGMWLNDQNMANVTNMTFTAGGVGTLDMSDGNITNVHVQTMKTSGTLNMSGGLIDFGGSTGRIELKGGSANIGALQVVGSTLQNQTEGNSVTVEQSVFNDKTIQTLNINALGGDDTTVNVEQSVFEGNNLSVDNFNVDTIYSRDSGALDIKASIVNLSDSATTNPIRITNVATPINDTDAANKAYVNYAVQENVQGLKPRKATDCSLFGGYASAGQASDFDMPSGNVFGTFTSYSIQHTANVATIDGNKVDHSELIFHLEGSGTLTFDGLAFDENELANIAASGTEATGPALAKKRVLIMNLNEDSIGSATGYDENLVAGSFAANVSELQGLNGIWEIQTYVDATYNSNPGKTLTMKRAADMNESDEVLNGAYTYVKYGSRSNYGFVVSSKDPIKIGDSVSGHEGLTIDGTTGTLMELEWIEFNNLDFELAFVNQSGDSKEVMGPTTVASTFEKGGIMMKYEATDEKQVMVNADLLRYETDSTVAGGLALQINGNIDFNLDPTVSSHINSADANVSVYVNGTQFERPNPTTFNMYTTNITANTITAESDRMLKKDIVDMENGLELVSKLHPVNYRWKDENKSQLIEYGFIAQEVEEHFPSLVHTNGTTGIKSVDYPKVVSMLALAVQELTAKVNELSASSA